MVNTTVKRKRASIDSAVILEKEDEGEGSIVKSRKISMATEPVEVEKPSEPDLIRVQTAVVSVDSTGSTPSLSQEHVGAVNEMGIEISVSVTTSAHKQILQQQWTTEAHKHLQRVHASASERVEESIGTEIMSENNFPDGYQLEQPDRQLVAAAAAVTPKTSARLSRAAAITAPAPRVVSQQLERSDAASSKALKVDTNHSTTDKDNSETVSEIRKNDSGDSSSSSSSCSSVPIVSAPVASKSEEKKDIPDVPAEEIGQLSAKKTAFNRMSIIGFITISIAILAILLRLPTTRNITSNTRIASTQSIVEDLLVKVLTPEGEDGMGGMARGSHLLQQLSGLEKEALFLNEILDRTESLEEEVQRMQFESDTEQKAFQLELESNLLALEKSVEDLEERTLMASASIIELQLETEGELNGAQVEAVADVARAFPVEGLREAERKVEGVERVVEEHTAAVAALEAPEGEEGEETEDGGETEEGESKDSPASIVKPSSKYEKEEMEGEQKEENEVEKETEKEVEKDDGGATAAVACAEAALSSLEQELGESNEELHRDVRSHMSVLAEAALIRATAAAELAAQAAAAASLEEEEEIITENETIAAAVPHSVPVTPSKGLHHMDLDYAVWPRGGRVVPPGDTATYNGEAIVLTSAPYILSLGPLKRLRYQLGIDREAADESVLISHSSGSRQRDQYSCYAFAGSTGSATVTMHSAVKVSAVQIVYRPRPGGKNGLTTAPNSIRLIGWTGVPSSQSEGIDLGGFTYDIEGQGEESDGLQTFTLSAKTNFPPLRAVTVKILSNHGATDYSSVCRVKVIGQL